MPWVNSPPYPYGLKGRESLKRTVETLATFQAAMIDRLSLPARWARSS